MIGQTLNNRYTITSRLGKGAMDTVYRATDKQTDNKWLSIFSPRVQRTAKSTVVPR